MKHTFVDLEKEFDLSHEGGGEMGFGEAGCG